MAKAASFEEGYWRGPHGGSVQVGQAQDMFGESSGKRWGGVPRLPDLGVVTTWNQTKSFVEVKLAIQFGADRKTDDKT